MKINLCAGGALLGKEPGRTLLFTARRADFLLPTTTRTITKVVVVPEDAIPAGQKPGTELALVPVERIRTAARLSAELAAEKLPPETVAATLERIGALLSASIEQANADMLERVVRGAPASEPEREEDRRRRWAVMLEDLGRDAYRADLPGLASALVSMSAAINGEYEETAARALLNIAPKI